MAGVFPLPMKTSGKRKQWNLYNEGRGPLRRIGSQLAEDGCPDSQVVLAKQLLDAKCDVDVDRDEKARLGVYWLIKASEQGHEEATNILRHCLESGQGMSEHNYMDVKACLDMTQEEKLARLAAREVFASMSAGEEFITSEQLQDRMSSLEQPKEQMEVDRGERVSANQNHTDNDWMSRTREHGEKLTEDVLISAASTYSRGVLPIVQRILSIEGQPSRSYHLPDTLFHPLVSISLSYSRILDSIGRHSFVDYLPLTIANFKTLAVVIVYATFGLDNLIAMFPMALYFISLSIMIIATCKILTTKRDFQHFRRWSRLFISYSGGSLNAAEAEFQYSCNNLRPYGLFLLALIALLAVTPFVPRRVLPHSEMAVLSMVATLITLYNFTVSSPQNCGKGFDYLGLFSFGVHVLAKYPYDADPVVSLGWRFLDVHSYVPTFASYVVCNGVEFCLNFRALFYLVIPAVLVKMASREHWRGFYTALIPHCLTLAWWQIALLSAEGATWYGLVRSALALVGLVLFLPLAGLATILLPVAAAGKVLSDSDQLVRLGTTFVLAALPLLLAAYLRRHTSASKFFSCVQVALAVIAALLLLSGGLESSGKEMAQLEMVTYTQYQQLCQLPQQADHTAAFSTQHCARLRGLPVRWQAQVKRTSIVRIHNPLKDIIAHLPESLELEAFCLFGERFKICKENEQAEASSSLCEPPQLAGRCHLNNWNRYEFEILVAISGGTWHGVEGEAVLLADDCFRNFSLSLSPNDHIWFAGTLAGNSDGIMKPNQPIVRLSQAGCLSCKDATIMNAVLDTLATNFKVANLYSAAKSILNFLFNPLVIFS